MKLQEYAKHIIQLAKKYPDADVVYARDDEGNGFQPVYYPPSAGALDDHGDYIVRDKKNMNLKITTVCIN